MDELMVKVKEQKLLLEVIYMKILKDDEDIAYCWGQYEAISGLLIDFGFMTGEDRTCLVKKVEREFSVLDK